MAIVPIVTDITAHVATFTASGYIDGIRAHLLATVLTSHCSIDAYTANEGLTIGFNALGETQQVNLRKSGVNTIALSVEPAGTITDPGNSVPTAPTGTTSDWSGNHQEPNWDVSWGTPGGSTKVWCVELPDAIFIVTSDTTNTFHDHIMHAGRIATSINSSAAAAAGQDGLGYVAGIPDNGIGSVNDWLGTACPCASLHWATDEWSDHISWNAAPSTADAASSAHTSFRPLPPGIWDAVDINGQASDPQYGPPKYLRTSDANANPMTVIPDPGSNQGWLRYNDALTTGMETMIWDKTVTP